MRKLFIGAAMLLHMPLTVAAEEIAAPLLPSIFNSHLHSAMMVSPAQLYAVEGMQTDLTLGYRKSDHETITTQGKWDFEWMSSILNLTAVTNLPVSGLNVGLNITSVLGEPDENIKGEGIFELLNTTTQSAHTKYDEINTLQIAPLLSYHLKDMISFGLRFNYQYVDRDYSPTRHFAATDSGNLHTSSSSYSLIPAFTVTAADFEAGIAWQTQESGDDVELPAMLTMHGRYAWDDSLNFGGIYQLRRWSALKAGHEDQSVLRATVEWQNDWLRIEGDVAYTTSYYQSEVDVTAHNIATMSAHTAFDYRITDNAVAGAAVGYTFGEETFSAASQASAEEYNMQEMDFALRGNYMF